MGSIQESYTGYHLYDSLSLDTYIECSTLE